MTKKFLVGVKYIEGVMQKQKLPAEIHDYFVKMGKIGGEIGGKARAEKLSPERRKEIAKAAIAARWEKKRELG